MNPQIKVHQQIPQSGYWDEVMLSPFKTEEEAWDYIKKYRKYFPQEYQNYRITTPDKVHYFHGCF